MDLCQSQFLACRTESTDATSAEEERGREVREGGGGCIMYIGVIKLCVCGSLELPTGPHLSRGGS